MASDPPTFAVPLGFLGLGRREHDTAISIAGIPLDIGTTNRSGARFGPQAIRHASRMLVDGAHRRPGSTFRNCCCRISAILAFRAEDDDNARTMIDDQEGGVQSDLKALVGEEGKPLWDGKSAIQAQEATAAQHAEWEQSRDQAISDEEIDLDAGDDPDEWSVYLTSIPQTK